MKKLLYSSLILLSAFFSAQKNTFLSQDFWKTKPTLELVKTEIERGNSVSEKNGGAFDPVTLAINNKANTEVIKFLVEQPGNSVDKITHDGRIYLHWAAMSGNTDLVEYLIKKGSDVNFKDTKGTTPLVFASNAGVVDPKIYQLFFNRGVQPTEKYKNGANILMLSAGNDDSGNLRKFLLTKGLKLSDTDDYGSTAFDYAAAFGKMDVLKSLISEKVKPTDKALLFAAQGTRSVTNGLPVYKYLIEDLKLNPKVTNESGTTVLHLIARKNNQSENITYFIGKGVKAEALDKDGNTALMLASSGKDLENVKTLLSQSKNINSVNANGQSALTMAVENGSEEIVAFLLNNKADVNISDKKGNNLAYYLLNSYRPPQPNQKDQFSEKLMLLKNAGFDISKPQKDGNTLYHLAAAKNDLLIFEKLDFKNADINALNGEKLTALQKAALISKNDKMLKYLVAKGASKTAKTEFDETAYDLATENEELKKNNVSLDFLK
ncbi:hypothetical protein ASG01_02865 [Chryseobacterium sp. Leaf180]|uniref:ankyrin repeat domain-containing protein n=1 Tax=Chryseobacterium sp. Leaf180 TaxID=1736289 RepID=UPI0006F4E698|nr:ankyrin repeat domain-containing protein [Chryseobacterium sp. Leaf180]KQR94823.1 hypothetical protein ASG01_02865 [Chryseobacterium sp. Leaf180]